MQKEDHISTPGHLFSTSPASSISQQPTASHLFIKKTNKQTKNWQHKKIISSLQHKNTVSAQHKPVIYTNLPFFYPGSLVEPRLALNSLHSLACP